MAWYHKKVPDELQAYWTFWEEITVEDGLVLKGTRIVISKNKHNQILTMIHEGHLGLRKCKLWVKDTVYWPGINEQLEQLVSNCKLCLKYSKAKGKQPSNISLGQEIPKHPWTKVATDIFYFDGNSYLLIVDYTSRFPIMRKLTSTTAQHVASQMKLVFSDCGWPETIISDNRPCYPAETFTKLMKDYSVNHITGSPHNLQSNELAEKYVQIVKNYSIKPKKKEKIYTKAWWSTETPHYQAIYNHPCRFYIHELQGHNSLYPMQPENSLEWLQNNWDWKTRMNSCLHMTYI